MEASGMFSVQVGVKNLIYFTWGDLQPDCSADWPVLYWQCINKLHKELGKLKLPWLSCSFPD